MKITFFKTGIVLLLLFSIAQAQQVDSTAAVQPLSENAKRNNIQYFSKAIEKKLVDDVQGAIHYYELALKENPADDASMYELSDFYIRAGRVDEAFTMIEKAVELQPQNKWYLLRISKFLELMKDYDRLIGIYNQLLAIEPDNWDFTVQLINSYLDTEQYDKALEQINILEQQHGINENTTLQKTEILFKQGKNKEAIEEMNALIASFPSETRYLSLLAGIYTKEGRHKEALETYLKIKQINPLDAYVDVAMLETYEKLNKDDLAFASLIDAIRNPNLDFNTKTQIYEYWFQKKSPLKQINQQAKQAATAFIEIYPEHSIGYMVMGSYFLNIKDFATAKQYYEKALIIDKSYYYTWQQMLMTMDNMPGTPAQEYLTLTSDALKLFPEQPIFYWYSALANMDLGNLTEAIRLLENSRRLVTDKKLLSTYNATIGDLYHQQKDFVKAYAAYDRALVSDPNNAAVLNNYAYFLVSDQKPSEAESSKALNMAEQAVELEPKNAIYLDTYAWVLYSMGQYDKAAKWMSKTIAISKSDNATYFEHYGDILYKVGQTKKALKYWKKAKLAGTTSKLIDLKIKDKQLYE